MPLPEWYTSPFRYKQADLDQMDLYNKQIEDYKTAAEAYNAALDKYKTDVELYNERVNAWNAGPRTSDFGYKPPAEFTMAQPKALDFTQEDLDAFQQEAQARATRAQQARNTAYTAAINPSQYNLAGFSFADGGDVSADRAAFIKQWYDEKYGDRPSRYVVNDRGYMTDPRYKALIASTQNTNTPPTNEAPTVIDKSATSVAPTVINKPSTGTFAAPEATATPSTTPEQFTPFYPTPSAELLQFLKDQGVDQMYLVKDKPDPNFRPYFPSMDNMPEFLQDYLQRTGQLALPMFAQGGPVDARPAYQRLLAAIQGPRNLAEGGDVVRDPLAVSEEGITAQGPRGMPEGQAKAELRRFMEVMTPKVMENMPVMGMAVAPKMVQRMGEEAVKRYEKVSDALKELSKREEKARMTVKDFYADKATRDAAKAELAEIQAQQPALRQELLEAMGIPPVKRAEGSPEQGEMSTDEFVRQFMTEDQAVQDAERTHGEYLQQEGKEQKYENVYDALFRRNVDVKTNEDYRPDLLPIFRSAAVRAVMGERPTAGVDYEHYPALPSGVSSRGAVSDRKSRSKMTAADELSLVNDAIKSIGGGTLKVDDKGNLYLTDYYDFNMTDPTKIRDLYGAQRFGMGVLDKLGMLHNYRTELNLGNKYDLFSGLSKEEVDAALQRAKVQTFTPQGRKVVNPEPIGGTPDGA